MMHESLDPEPEVKRRATDHPMPRSAKSTAPPALEPCPRPRDDEDLDEDEGDADGDAD